MLLLYLAATAHVPAAAGRESSEMDRNAEQTIQQEEDCQQPCGD